MEVHGVAQRIWPQSKVDSLRPAGVRVEQLFVRALQDIANGLLSKAILEVRIYATKGELLSCIMTCLSEGNVMGLPLVAVVVEDYHSVFSRVLLKGKLGKKCLCQQIVDLKVNKAETAEMVDKHGDALVALLGEFSFQLCVKSHFIDIIWLIEMHSPGLVVMNSS